MSAATNISRPELSVLAPLTVNEGGEFFARIANISRQSFVYFAGTVVTAASGYFFKIYLARALGPEMLGLYALGMTIIGFTGVFNTIGLPTAAARFVAAYSARGETSKLVAFLRDGLALLAGLNVLLVTAIVVAGPWFATRFYHAPKLNAYFWAFAGIMALGVLNTFLGQILAGYQAVAQRTLITHFIGTPANIAIAVCLISVGLGLTGYLLAQVLSAVLVLCLLGTLVWRRTPKYSALPRTTFHLGSEVLSFSAAAFGITVLQFFLAQADMIVLGHYVSARQVGVYSVAMALVGFVSVVLDSVNQIFSPVISELHAAGNKVLLQQLYSALTKWIVILTFPLALTLVLFSRELMSIFGASFQPGAAVLVLGTIGQMLNCGVGSVGYLLLMSGNQSELIRIQGVNAAVLITLNLALIPKLGITGAAVATTIETITTNLWALHSARRFLKLSPYHAGYLKLLAPAAASIVCLSLLSIAVAGFLRQWQVAGLGLILGYLIFLGGIYLVGFEHEDRQLARLAWASIGQGFRKMAIAA